MERGGDPGLLVGVDTDVKTSVFERIVVGIDGSDNALDAARLANELRAPSGRLVAVAVAETPYAVHTGSAAPLWTARLRAEATEACEALVEELDEPAIDTEVVEGRAAEKLLDVIRARDADLVAVGSGNSTRAAGMLLGSVATRLIHDAPCSVLVARGGDAPRRVVVGNDGSEQAAEADAVAQTLGDIELHRLVATGGKPLTGGHLIEAELDARSPVDALVHASETADLIVVGSRGLHGMGSLGSVAERVAHAAKCSVLIVRGR